MGYPFSRPDRHGSEAVETRGRAILTLQIQHHVTAPQHMAASCPLQTHCVGDR